MLLATIGHYLNFVLKNSDHPYLQNKNLKIINKYLLKNQISSFTAGVDAVADKKDDAAKEVNSKMEALIKAVKGFGIASFTYAVLARGISGLVTIYLISPWKVGFGFSALSAKKLLSFGVPFQINSVLALIKDRLVPLVVARMVGPVGIGYVTWSQSMAYLPLEIMNIMIRITLRFII